MYHKYKKESFMEIIQFDNFLYKMKAGWVKSPHPDSRYQYKVDINYSQDPNMIRLIKYLNDRFEGKAKLSCITSKRDLGDDFWVLKRVYQFPVDTVKLILKHEHEILEALEPDEHDDCPW